MPQGPKRALFTVLIAALLALAGCDFPLAALNPTAPPTASPFPSPLPQPTVEILTSAELYARETRHIGETSPSYASFPVGAALPPLRAGDSPYGVSVPLAAETVLSGELFQLSPTLQPALLLLGADRAAFGALPARLAEAGFVVLLLETDARVEASQVEIMLQSLIALPGVDASRIGILGAAPAADIAAIGCAVNSLCDALALLSPRARATLLNMLPSLGPRPLWLAASQADSEAFNTASALAAAARGETHFFQVAAGQGAGLLSAQPELANQLTDWFIRQLQVQE